MRAMPGLSNLSAVSSDDKQGRQYTARIEQSQASIVAWSLRGLACVKGVDIGDVIDDSDADDVWDSTVALGMRALALLLRTSEYGWTAEDYDEKEAILAASVAIETGARVR